MKTIELLAPARDYECGCAALTCGADALYVGAPRFGARAGAAVTQDDIARLCTFAHRYEAKVYVTMNTLVYENELFDAEHIAREMWNAGADALIVQDMAFLRMDLPPIELHASTQTFNADPARARFLSEAGFSRIILERALTLDEIRRVSDTVPGTEIETFVHGAICVSYSGRCYMSRTTSARSGNRGVCSQSCRLPYHLLDENMRPILKDKHLLSLQDMNLSENLEELADAGVTSFKIEGRLKDRTYVRNVVSWYRRKLDAVIARREDLVRASTGRSEIEFDPDPAKSFSRGGTSYFIQGLGRNVASFDTPKSQGEPLGRVSAVTRDWFEIGTSLPLAPGDGICFADASGAFVGTNINKTDGKRVYPNRMDGIRPGTEVYRNYDHLFVSAVNRSRIRRTIPLSACIEIGPRQITLRFSDGAAEAVQSREGVFDPAKNPEKAEETLRTQIAKTGDTIYEVLDIEVIADTARFVPISLLNELRRDTLAELDKVRSGAYVRRERLSENTDYSYPSSCLSGEDNVVNSLAERFYRDHGVTQIERGYDLEDDLTGRRVMQMRYCLRREMGQCLRDDPAYRGKLYLENGLHIYELRFDCARCGMDVIYRGQREKIVKR